MSYLEIYILGPKSSDVKIYFAGRTLGYIQKFGYSCEVDSNISSVDLNICSFKIYESRKARPNMEKDFVKIAVSNFDQSPSEQIVRVCLGREQVDLISKIEFKANINSIYNELILYPAMRNEIFEKFPSWVTIDYSRTIKEAI